MFLFSPQYEIQAFETSEKWNHWIWFFILHILRQQQNNDWHTYRLYFLRSRSLLDRDFISNTQKTITNVHLYKKATYLQCRVIDFYFCMRALCVHVSWSWLLATVWILRSLSAIAGNAKTTTTTAPPSRPTDIWTEKFNFVFFFFYFFSLACFRENLTRNMKHDEEMTNDKLFGKIIIITNSSLFINDHMPIYIYWWVVFFSLICGDFQWIRNMMCNCEILELQWTIKMCLHTLSQQLCSTASYELYTSTRVCHT